MKKISIRIEDDILTEVDSFVDYFTIKNRSQAFKHLLKRALGEQRIAVILAKGSDLTHSRLSKNLLINKNEYNITAKLENTTLIEEQLNYLQKYKFSVVYILYPKKIIKVIQDVIGKSNKLDIKYFEINNLSQTANALRILKGKIHSNFLLIYGDVISDLNLENIYMQHLKNNAICTMMITTSKNPSIKGSVTIEGNKIINFIEKIKVGENFIVSEPIFVMSPEIFDFKGKSLPYNVFPHLAKEKKLDTHFSSSIVLHLHKSKDKNKIIEFIKKKKIH